MRSHLHGVRKLFCSEEKLVVIYAHTQMVGVLIKWMQKKIAQVKKIQITLTSSVHVFSATETKKNPQVSTFTSYAPFYSLENAVGMVIATGNTGDGLRFEPDITHTYLSKDAGLTWTEVFHFIITHTYLSKDVGLTWTEVRTLA